MKEFAQKPRRNEEKMKEQLYTIPVSDAFNEDCECPLCFMWKTLEDSSIEYTMGPSYMEDDVRASTDKAGFCEKHLNMMYENQNRLGLSLILSTHMDETIKNIEKLSKGAKPASPSLFKKSGASGLKSYIDNLYSSCFVCSRIENTFERYLITIFHLYKHEEDFRTRFADSKGFCTKHYGIMYEMAPSYLKGDMQHSFLTALNQVYLDNMKRVRADLEWFKDKFDYRYADAPWKNSKDALPRTMTKTNSIL